MNDMNTVGFTGPLPEDIAIRIDPARVTIGGGVTFGCVQVGTISTSMIPQLANPATSAASRCAALSFSNAALSCVLNVECRRSLPGCTNVGSLVFCCGAHHRAAGRRLVSERVAYHPLLPLLSHTSSSNSRCL